MFRTLSKSEKQNKTRHLFTLILMLSIAGAMRAPIGESHRDRSTTTSARASQAFARLPLSFEAASDRSGGFRVRGRGYDLSLTATEATLALRKSERKDGKREKSLSLAPFAPAPTSFHTLRMKLAGADPAAKGSGIDPLPGKSNYFIGNDPSRWRTHVPTFAKASFEAVYPGIDLVYYGNGRQLEYDFVLAPGADPARIGLNFEGAERMEVDEAGDLVLHTPAGKVRQQKPVIYQEADGVRTLVDGGYVIRNQMVGFEIGDYDRERTLVIDPTLVYSTYLGSSSGGTVEDIIFGDLGYDIAVDAAGNAYITGATTGADFPTEKPVQRNPGGGDCGIGPCPDVVVVKLNAEGNALLYSTYLGGDFLDTGSSIAVDAGGNAYVTGTTASDDFPIRNAFQSTLKGFDAFVAKLNADGSALVYSTYFGGEIIETGVGIAVDSAGNASITGITLGSTDLPVEKPLQRTPGGGACAIGGETIPCPDAFVTKLNAAGNGLVFSTYLGGASFDFGNGIATDAAGQVYLTGMTVSNNFPTRNAVQPSFAGGRCIEPLICFDAFVTKITADGSALVYSTYFGGSQAASGEPIEFSHGIAADAAGNAYLTGTTDSRDLPLKNAARSTISGFGSDAFVTKFDPAGALVYSTFLGGSSEENFLNFFGAIFSLTGFSYSSSSIAADADGNAYVTGTTESTDFPSVNPIPGSSGSGMDAFVTKFGPAGAIVYSTRLGGGGDEGGFGIAVDAAGSAYLTGVTSSNNFPLLNPRQARLNGESDLFITKLTPGGSVNTTPVATVSAASFSGAQVAAESVAAAFGTNLATRTETANATPLPTTLAGTTVRVRDIAGAERLAPLFFVAPTQINYQVPQGTVAGNAAVTITSGDGTVSTGTVRIALAAPGLFAANANGQGVAAAVALRVRNGVQAFEPVAQLDAAQNRFVPIPIDLGPETDQVFLIPFGTGVRFRSSLSAVTASVGGTNAPVSYAGAQGSLVGVDQINLLLPRSLAGRGLVNVVLTVDGQTANTVNFSIR